MAESHKEWCSRLVSEVNPSNRAKNSFAYYGELPLGTTWGFFTSQHRDSDVLERSNWEVIHQDLGERFPDDVHVVSCNHWAVGWMEHMAVRLLEADGEPTQVSYAVKEWADKLENYPVADEEHLNALETGGDDGE